jgi:hypothetical protein
MNTTTTETETKKQYFCYNINNGRWPMQKESYPLLRKKMIEIFEYEFENMDLLLNGGKLDCIPTGSIINKYGKNQQRKMLELLKAYVLEDKETSNQEDLILEEMLYHIVTKDIDLAYDQYLDGFEDSFNEWKAIFDAGEEKEEYEAYGEVTDEDIYQGLYECLWWDLDWEIFQVKKRDYSKVVI